MKAWRKQNRWGATAQAGHLVCQGGPAFAADEGQVHASQAGHMLQAQLRVQKGTGGRWVWSPSQDVCILQDQADVRQEARHITPVPAAEAHRPSRRCPPCHMRREQPTADAMAPVCSVLICEGLLYHL